MGIVEGVENIEKYLPHRFENVLIDRVEAYEENEEKLLAKTELTIKENDAYGRDLFLIKNQRHQLVFNPHMFPEHLALGALVYMNTMQGEGYAALFSTISNFKKSGDIKTGEKMTAHIYLKRSKAGFQTFSGKIYNPSDECIAETEIMAYAFKADEAPEAGEGDKKKTEPPVISMDKAVDFSRINNRQSSMFFGEKIVNYNREDQTMIVSFEYPKDHPFVKGHFPDNPIMMGICQWMSSGDALDVLALELLDEQKVGQRFSLSANVDLLKEDGTLVAEIKNIEKSYLADGRSLKPETVSTKKCGFRDMVQPGDRVFQRISGVKLS